MRIISQLTAAIILTATTGLAGVANADEIGRFSVTVDNHDRAFISNLIPEGADEYYSDLSLMGTTTLNMIRVEGSVDPDLTQPEFPYISLTISGTSQTYTSLMNIQLIDASYEELFLADAQNGQRHIENIMLDSNGSISFDFSADLVRVNPENNVPIDGASGAHIEGSYVGQIPASEQKD